MTHHATADAVRARRELRGRLHDVLKAVRVFKSHQPPRRTPIPTGIVGVLGVIDGLSTPATDPASASDATSMRVAAGGCHVKDLAAHSALDPSTVSRAVAALVRLGLVRRTADPTDGRASCLALTAAGRDALSETHQWYDDLLADALADWTPRELTAFAGMLRRFSDDVMTHLDTHQNPSTSTNTLEAAR
jgi:DNA-binding MarR family transcriptional regulator